MSTETRFRKRPVEVDAMQVREIMRLGIEKGPGGMPEWLVQAIAVDPATDEGHGGVSRLEVFEYEARVRTRQDQWVSAGPEEWICCAASDDLWPVDPEAFVASYEPITREDRTPEEQGEDRWPLRVWVAVAKEPMRWAAPKPLISLDRGRLAKASPGDFDEQPYYPAGRDEEAIRADVEAKLEARLLSDEAVEAATRSLWGDALVPGQVERDALRLRDAFRAALSAQEKAEEGRLDGAFDQHESDWLAGPAVHPACDPTIGPTETEEAPSDV